MKEIRNPNPLPPVRRLSQDGLIVELYRVLCFFHASKVISSPEDDINFMPAVQMLAEEVQESEIIGALVSASIKLRLLDEQLWNARQEVKEKFGFTVGQIWNQEAASNPEDLSIRDACNKIVHADDIGFFVDDTQYRTSSFLIPRYLESKIAAYGSYRGNTWRAEVEIDRFCEAGYWFARYA